MSKIVYTLKQHPRTLEYHLFKSTPTLDKKCRANDKSMCQKMDWVSGAKFACASEQESFIKCAELGTQVCGNCMKELYGTKD